MRCSRLDATDREGAQGPVRGGHEQRSTFPVRGPLERGSDADDRGWGTGFVAGRRERVEVPVARTDVDHPRSRDHGGCRGTVDLADPERVARCAVRIGNVRERRPILLRARPRRTRRRRRPPASSARQPELAIPLGTVPGNQRGTRRGNRCSIPPRPADLRPPVRSTCCRRTAIASAHTHGHTASGTRPYRSPRTVQTEPSVTAGATGDPGCPYDVIRPVHAGSHGPGGTALEREQAVVAGVDVDHAVRDGRRRTDVVSRVRLPRREARRALGAATRLEGGEDPSRGVNHHLVSEDRRRRHDRAAETSHPDDLAASDIERVQHTRSCPHEHAVFVDHWRRRRVTDAGRPRDLETTDRGAVDGRRPTDAPARTGGKNAQVAAPLTSNATAMVARRFARCLRSRRRTSRSKAPGAG